MRVETVFFDLDGTITDSAPGIMNSIRYALRKHGMEIPAESVLRSFVGPPLCEQFQKVFGLTPEEGAGMVSSYREYFADQGIFENSVYDGVPDMLDKLKKAGMRIMMATSKPETFAVQIAEYFDFAQYFDFIGGASLDGSRTEKYDVIQYVLKGLGKKNGDGIVMVGDRSHDMIGAKRSGIPGLGVLYGYGSRRELAEAGAWKLAATPEETAEILLNEQV